MLSTKEYVLILGAGQTGISAAKFLKKNNFKIFGSLIESSKNIDEIDFNSKCAVIMGTEADSISSEFIEQSNECFKIPMTGNVDSLNLSVSTGIILYEVMNQRKSINFSK